MDEIHFTLTADDFWHLQLHILSRGKRTRLNIFLLCIVIILCPIFLITRSSGTPTDIISIILIVLFSCLLILALIFGLSFLIMHMSASGATKTLRNRGVHVASISEQGLREKNELGDGITYWQAFKTIEEDKHNLYFQVDNPGRALLVLLIPKRAFESPSQAESFIELARGHWREQTSHPR